MTERIRSFTPIDVVPLPRPLHRFGNAFPATLAETYTSAYTSRCGTCRGSVVVEACLWERDAPLPTKKAFRCGICAREGRSLLIEPVAAEDEDRTRALEERGLAHWQLVERFGEDAELGESVAAR